MKASWFVLSGATVASFRFATKSFRVFGSVQLFPPQFNYANSQGLTPPSGMTHLNDTHEGWNNRDTTWCFHYSPKFQSSSFSLRLHTFPIPTTLSHSKSSRILCRNPRPLPLLAPCIPFFVLKKLEDHSPNLTSVNFITSASEMCTKYIEIKLFNNLKC